MHIPDGIMDVRTAVTTGVLAAGGLGLALHQAKRNLPPRRVPLLGLSAAFIFAAQMINFPVAGGTSGHLIGGVLAAVLLGPSGAVIVISAVLIVQCFMFTDGGVWALGVNIFNMALVGGVGGWAIYYAVSRVFKGLFGRVLAAAFAGWCSTVLASIACAGELAATPYTTWSVAFPMMAGVHMLIGIGEGLITALVLVAISQTRPELLVEPNGGVPVRRYGPAIVYGLLISLGLALFVSPFASQSPDGLDRSVEKLKLDDKAKVVMPAPMADYKIKWLTSAKLGTSIAGGVGTIVVFGLSWLLARSLVRRDSLGGQSKGSG